ICVGQRIVARFPRTGIGETLRFAGRDWSVVCHFAAGGSAFESEIWGENEQFMPVFRGQVFQSITMRLSDPGAFAEVKRALETDKRMTVDVHRESDFYVQQSQLLGRLFRPPAAQLGACSCSPSTASSPALPTGRASARSPSASA